MNQDGLRFYEDDDPPQASPFATIPECVWKKIVDWTYADDSNDAPWDVVLPRLLRDGNVPPEVIKEIMSSIGIPAESILGLYRSASNQIILFPPTIKLCARSLKVKDTILKHVVLVHEMGHWFHKVTVGNSPVPTYSNSSTELKECIAQWFAANLFSTVKRFPPRPPFRPSGASDVFVRDYEDAFVKLNIRQSQTYKCFQQFSGKSPEAFIAAMKSLRSVAFNTDLPDFAAAFPPAKT